MVANALHRKKVEKRSAKKARVEQHVANARAHNYKNALVISWLAFVVLFIFSLVSREVGLRQMCLP